MTLDGLLLDVVSAVLFLAVLWAGVFLILPVASMAANAKERAPTWAFFGLMAFDLYWVFNGYGLLQDVFAGRAFESVYWSWDLDLSLAGAGRSLWALVSWAAYLAVLGFLGFVVLASLSGVTGSARGRRLFPLAVFAGLACLGYLWARGGRGWLMALFA